MSGARLATRKAIAAATTSASGRSIGSMGRLTSVLAQRAQRALAPGESGGTRCRRSQ
jgi:hypothetical protein